MKILILSAENFFSTYGGGQSYVKNLVDELINQGVLPVIVCPGEHQKTKTYKGCRIISLPSVSHISLITQLLKSENPDLVHAHGFKVLFAKACKELGIPIIITAHHGGILCPSGALLNYKDQICKIKANPKDCLPCVLKNTSGGIYAWPFMKIMPEKYQLNAGKLIKKTPFLYYITPVATSTLSIYNKLKEWKDIYTNSNLIIAPSRAIAESMILNDAPRSKIKIIPHGIPLPDISQTSLNTESKSEQKSYLKFYYVGRIAYEKGIHIMLAAFERLKNEAELHIIGGTGNKKEGRYASKLEKKHAGNRKIVWHGKVAAEELNEYIKPFDVMIHPTICLEVFGLTISEALAKKKPVIATRCGGAEMQIVDGENGMLVEPNDVGSLEKAIRTYSEDYKIKGAVLKVNPKTVVSINTHVNKLMGIYAQVYKECQSKASRKNNLIV